MKSFSYSMENILKHRKNIEEDEKQKFSQIQKEYILQNNILNEFEEKLQKANSSLFEKGSRETIKLKNRQQYIHFLQEKIVIRKQLIKKIQEELDLKRKQMVYAQRERKIIERHKEKTFDKYTNSLNKYEQNVIDELALYSYMRR